MTVAWTAPELHRLPCYAQKGTRGSWRDRLECTASQTPRSGGLNRGVYLELDTTLGANAGLKRVLHRRHFCDGVG